MNTSEFKEIIVTLIKAPTFIPLVVTFILTNQQWLFPQIPENVVQSFLNLLTYILGGIALFYTGKVVQQNVYKREALAQLKLQSLQNNPQKLEE